MRIEIEDTPQPLPVSLGQALLRAVLGGIAMLHGMLKLLQPEHFAAQLIDLQLPEADTLTHAMIAFELGVGVCLVLGRFTRSAACLWLCDLAANTALAIAQDRLWDGPAQLETLALGVACCVFFMIVGGGPLGLDHVLRQRARMRAIAKDPIWSRPPYVTHR
jgi:uncharacterized membrane protein YphA (DoxX/SURF4 family)